MASYNQNVNTPINTLEYQKFVTLGGTEYPAITSVRTTTLDNGTTYSLSSIFPKTAVLTYLTNASDISVSLSAGNINVNVADIETLLTTTNTLINSVSALLGKQLGTSGVVFCQPSDGAVAQNFNAVQVLSACKFSAITIANSTTTGLINYEFPQNFVLTAPITSLTLSYGAVIAFKQ